MALAVGMANSVVEFVFPTSEEVGHPSVALCRRTRTGGVRARVGWVAALALAVGCVSTPPRPDPILVPPGTTAITPAGIADILEDNPCPADQPLSSHTLAETKHHSIHLVQIRTREPRHLHATHDLTVFVHQGRGAIMIHDGERDHHFPATVGDLFYIPRNTPHFAVADPHVPLILIGVFTPAFDSKDSIPAPGPRP